MLKKLGLSFAVLFCLLDADFEEQDQEKIKKAVDKGLYYLHRMQTKRGDWGEGSVVTVSTALLAFLAEGSTLEEGRYKENIKRAVKFLLRRSRKSGIIGSNDYSAMQTPLAMIALLEVYLKTNDTSLRKRIKEQIERSIKRIKRYQQRLGGWGYDLTHNVRGITIKGIHVENNAGSTYSMVFALSIARDLGFKVGKDTIERAAKLLLKLISPRGRSIYGMDNDGSKKDDRWHDHFGLGFFRTAAILGAFKKAEIIHPRLKKVKRYLKRSLKDLQYENIIYNRHVTYASIFAFLGMKICEEGYQKWQKRFEKFFIRNQQKDGGWRSPDPRERAWISAIALLALQLSKGKLKNF